MSDDEISRGRSSEYRRSASREPHTNETARERSRSLTMENQRVSENERSQSRLVVEWDIPGSKKISKVRSMSRVSSRRSSPSRSRSSRRQRSPSRSRSGSQSSGSVIMRPTKKPRNDSYNDRPSWKGDANSHNQRWDHNDKPKGKGKGRPNPRRDDRNESWNERSEKGPDPNTRYFGRICTWNRGYGFIQCKDFDCNVFVHRQNVNASEKELPVNTQVEFYVEMLNDGKWNAKYVKITGGGSSGGGEGGSYGRRSSGAYQNDRGHQSDRGYQNDRGYRNDRGHKNDRGYQNDRGYEKDDRGYQKDDRGHQNEHEWNHRRERGHDDGYDQGQSRGYDQGQSRGYDKGQDRRDQNRWPPSPQRSKKNPKVFENVQGTVNRYNLAKGFGFIECEQVNESIFVHNSSIIAEGFRKLDANDIVTCDVERLEDGRYNATNVRVLYPAEGGYPAE